MTHTIRKGTRLTGPARELLLADLTYHYVRGATLRDLADQTGRGYGTVHHMLTEAGVPLRSKGGKPRP